MSIWVIGHWCSCNMGDKYQPYVVANKLISEIDYFGSWDDMKNIYLVNFSSNKTPEPLTFMINNKEYNILTPESDIPDADLAVITTGSMDGNSPYVSWVKKYLESGRIKKLTIWGGFSPGNMEIPDFCNWMDFLKRPNIKYYARCQRDYDLFVTISSDPSRGRLAGDPMVWWANTNNIHSHGELLIVIPSIYAFRHNFAYWDKICAKADIVIFIDTYSDRRQLERYTEKALMFNDPTLLCKIIKSAKHVISGRLHGSVLAACSMVPTTMIITDNSEPGKGSYKFDAVGKTCVGHDSPLCETLTVAEAEKRINSNDTPHVYADNIDKYIKLTNESLDDIKNDVLAILSNM